MHASIAIHIASRLGKHWLVQYTYKLNSTSKSLFSLSKKSESHSRHAIRIDRWLISVMRLKSSSETSRRTRKMDRWLLSSWISNSMVKIMFPIMYDFSNFLVGFEVQVNGFICWRGTFLQGSRASETKWTEVWTTCLNDFDWCVNIYPSATFLKMVSGNKGIIPQAARQFTHWPGRPPEKRIVFMLECSYAYSIYGVTCQFAQKYLLEIMLWSLAVAELALPFKLLKIYMLALETYMIELWTWNQAPSFERRLMDWLSEKISSPARHSSRWTVNWLSYEKCAWSMLLFVIMGPVNLFKMSCRNSATESGAGRNGIISRSLQISFFNAIIGNNTDFVCLTWEMICQKEQKIWRTGLGKKEYTTIIFHIKKYSQTNL